MEGTVARILMQVPVASQGDNIVKAEDEIIVSIGPKIAIPCRAGNHYRPPGANESFALKDHKCIGHVMYTLTVPGICLAFGWNFSTRK